MVGLKFEKYSDYLSGFVLISALIWPIRFYAYQDDSDLMGILFGYMLPLGIISCLFGILLIVKRRTNFPKGIYRDWMLAILGTIIIISTFIQIFYLDEIVFLWNGGRRADIDYERGVGLIPFIILGVLMLLFNIIIKQASKGNRYPIPPLNP
jgi:hypothetical protein